MKRQTLIASLVMAAVLAAPIGALPEMARGLYVGSAIAPGWLDRVAVGDLGYRAKAVLTRHTRGILMERSGATPLWIPEPSITAIRTETFDGILAIRWRLPSGTEIDTGFRGDDRRKYVNWLEART